MLQTRMIHKWTAKVKLYSSQNVFGILKTLRLFFTLSNDWHGVVLSLALAVGFADASRHPMEGVISQNLSSSTSHTSHRKETVNISARLVDGNGRAEEYRLHTLEDMDRFQSYISTYPNHLELFIERSSNHSIVVYLTRNAHIIPKGFKKKYFSKTGEAIVEQDSKYTPLSRCFFTGNVVSVSDSLASFNLCNGIKGVVDVSEKEFAIETFIVKGKIHYHWNEQVLNNKDEYGECTAEDSMFKKPPYNPRRRHNRFRRDLRLPAGVNASTKYIELYVVMDHSIYIRTGSLDATIMRAVNMINYASGLYRRLNMYLVLVGLEVWNDGDKITNKPAEGSEGEYDDNWMLAEFNKYRHYVINRETPNDSGQLFSALDFQGATIGKGSSGTICMHTDSGGVTYDQLENVYSRAASTMAHELGHNLNMGHSNINPTFNGIGCECEYPGDPDFKVCVMYSFIPTSKFARKWSECTKYKLARDLEQNLGQCLMNKPEMAYKIGNSAICGNFFVEEGEECDCGQPADCLSKCCDASTCKLHKNATCATGACCDLETCTVSLRSVLCRPSQDSECDLEEYCDGSSEWCPKDTYKYDGAPCYNRGEAYCYEGKCNSHNSQCHFIWGRESAKSSNDTCYSRNGEKMYFGNCGWVTSDVSQGNGYLERDFLECQAEQDKFCGLLHCIYDDNQNLTVRLKNYPLAKYRQRFGGSICISSAFDVGYKEFDPGQTPNGAKCGNNSMCVNSRCVPVPDKGESCNCNGHGVCNQKLECHCDFGWAPPFCKTKGLGGSASSNHPLVKTVNLTLIAGLVAFFCGIVPLIVVSILVIHRRQHALKAKYHNIINRFKRNSSRPPSNPLVGLSTVDTEAGHSNRHEKKGKNSHNRTAISSPIFQSTTNNETTNSLKSKSGQSKASEKSSSKAGPTWAAPPPPTGSHKITSSQPTYENISPTAHGKSPRASKRDGSSKHSSPKPAIMPKPKLAHR